MWRKAAGVYIKYVYLPERPGSVRGEELLQELTAGYRSCCFLANPNNPRALLMGREYLPELLEHCRQQGITVVLDECFIEFCETDREQPKSLLGKIDQYMRIYSLVRAFTKSFAMPGVRLGYLVCSNAELREKIRRQLPEWNLSVFCPESRHRLCGAGGAISARYSGICENNENIFGKDWRAGHPGGVRRSGFPVAVYHTAHL